MIIGESINASIPRVGEAIAARDHAFIAGLARQQVECGAQMIDVCAAMPDRDQADDLVWTVGAIQQAVETPLVLDSADPLALRAAASTCRGPFIISSVTGEEGRLSRLLPLAAEKGCGLVALCMDGHGIPDTAEGRFQVAAELTRSAVRAGIKHDQLWLDPLVLSIGADFHAGEIALETLALIRSRLPDVHTVCGVSNVSFGMPNRRLLNRAFLSMLVAGGMEGLLLDVRDSALMATLRAAMALAGKDPWCKEYLRQHRAGKLR